MDYRRRLEAFCRHLEGAGLDAYWLVSDANVRYLSGFTGHDSTLLVTPGRSVLVTDSRYVEQAKREARADEVVNRHTSMAQTVATLCKSLEVKKLGVTAANLSHADYEAAAKAAPSARVTAGDWAVAEKLRMRKDADEIEAIRAALRVAETTFSAFLKQVEPGRSEKWLAARLEYEMRQAGADGASFETICAAGARASVPHASSGNAVVTPGSSVLFDWGARLDGYCCDLTRVICTGTIPPKLDVLTDIVLEAQAAVLAKLKPGNRCGEADAAGRAVIAKAGYGRSFGHGIGHGVGLGVHEGPRLGPGAQTVLLPGMVLTVEPGIYLPGEIGVRIEQMALITPDGCEVLTTLPQRPGEFRVCQG